MLINFSNHPSSAWDKEQLQVAISSYRKIKDIPFPIISPDFTEIDIIDLAQKYIKVIINSKPIAVHVMGELNFTFKIVSILKLYNIKCIASTSERNSIEKDGTKLSTFRFIQFREY